MDESYARRYVGIPLLVALAGLIAAGCGPTAAPTGRAPEAYVSALCGAVQVLAGNQADFQTFVSDTSTAESALAALARMQDRTRDATERLGAAGQSWGPGADVARRLADNQRELSSILDAFEAVVTGTGDQASWTAARDRYTDWYDDSQTEIAAIGNDLSRLGVSCT